MFGILDNVDEDAGKTIAFGIGTFIMTAVIIGVPILTVISFIFSWLGAIQLILTITSLVIFVFLWSVVIDCCSD